MDKKYDIVTLGSCTMDMMFAVDDIMRMDIIDRDQSEKKYIAIENSTKLNVKQVKSFPGGSAANICCDLSNIGYKSAYIGGIGNDTNGMECLSDMQRHKVDISGVKIFDEDATATSVILITPWEKDRSILAYKGANNLISESHIENVRKMLESTKCFAWTSLTSNSGISAIGKAIDIAKKSNARVIAAPSISIIKNRLDETIKFLKLSEITSMNHEELLALTGNRDVKDGMRILFEWGLKIINITLGKDGQWLSDGKQLVKTKPPKQVPKDTTGAGDATVSGIIYGIMEGKSLIETAEIAVSLSAMEIDTAGVRVGTPEAYSQLKSFIESHEIEQKTSAF